MKLKRRIEVDSVLFSWLIPFTTEVINKFKIGPDGRTAYERITEHKCRHFMIGFLEVVDFILEVNKNERHKADSHVMKGVFLGYVWRSTEYLVGTKDGIYKCRTVRRRAEDIAYDPDCADFLKVSYNEYVLDGAKTTAIVRTPLEGGAIGPEKIPVRGREFVPRRVYTRPSDFNKHGFTEGCKGCVWAQNQTGTRYPHTDEQGKDRSSYRYGRKR